MTETDLRPDDERLLRERLRSLGAGLDSAATMTDPVTIVRTRRRPVRQWLVAAAALVVVAVGVQAVRGAGDPSGVDVVTTHFDVDDLPAVPTMDDSPFPVAGPVTVIDRGLAGDTPWWFIAFESERPVSRPDGIRDVDGEPEFALAYCSLIVDVTGLPFPGGGGCDGGLQDPTWTGLGTGFTHIGERDFLSGGASPMVDEIFVELHSGEIRRAQLFPVSADGRRPWMLELATGGPVESYLTRSQADIVRLVGVIDGVETVHFSGVSGVLPSTELTAHKRDPALELYCAAVEDLRLSGVDAATPAGVPFLEAVLAVAPDEIRPAQQQLLDAIRDGTPAGDAPIRATQYWARNCTG